MERLCTVRFPSAVRAVAARCKLPFCPPPGSSPRSLLLQPLPQLRLRHLAHCVFLWRHPPSHVRGFCFCLFILACDLNPTSAAERKSSTARPHLSSARRFRIFHRSFHLLASFRTSAHRVICWAFHSGHTLKRCSRVWFGYQHHQHCGVGRFFVRLRYCLVRQCPALIWWNREASLLVLPATAPSGL